MTKNTSEALNGVRNNKKGTPEGHPTPGVSPFPVQFPGPPAPKPKAVRASKTSADYWRDKVRHRTTRNGTPTPEFYVRLKRGGREAWFALLTANRAEAARSAKDLWLRVQSEGIDAVLKALRPEPRPERTCTVGEFILAAEQCKKVRPQVFSIYVAALRRVAAGVMGIEATSDRHASRDAWRMKVDAVRLDEITPAAVTAWRDGKVESTVAGSESGEACRTAAENSADTVLRNAKAMFSAKVMPALSQVLKLPEVLPFEGVSTPKSVRKLQISVDARELYRRAEELDPDTRTAFDLLIVCGMRRAEADNLPWDRVNLPQGSITIGAYRDWRPKSKTSERTAYPSPDMLHRLAELRRLNEGAEYVLARRMRREPTGRKLKTVQTVYNARAWDRLSEWLTLQGVTDRNPLHYLRKLSGNELCQAYGAHTAQKHLGHKDVKTTMDSYVASQRRVVDLSKPAPQQP